MQQSLFTQLRGQNGVFDGCSLPSAEHLMGITGPERGQKCQFIVVLLIGNTKKTRAWKSMTTTNNQKKYSPDFGFFDVNNGP